MNRLTPARTMIICVVMAIVLLAAGCASDEVTNPRGVQIVTEDELLLHAAEHTAKDMSMVMAGIMSSGQNQKFYICDHDTYDLDEPDKDWSDRVLTYVVGFETDSNGCELAGGGSGRIQFHWTFGKSVYVDGKVDESGCHKLPGGGTATTGEYQDVTNKTDGELSQHIEHKVEETKASETSLSETVDLTNKTSVEAGAEFPGGSAKVTTDFESHFGITSGSVASESSTKEETVSLDLTIKPKRIVSVVYVLDDSVTLCDIDIDSTVDYASVALRAYRHHCGDACDSHGADQLRDHDLWPHHGRNVNFSFPSPDDVVRLAAGANPICDGCKFDLGDAEGSYKDLSNPDDTRRVKINGTRRSTAKDSASWIVRDITGLDSDCVAGVLSVAGTSPDDVDDNLKTCAS